MRCINRIELLGFLGHDPELFRNQAGNPIVKMSIGISSVTKDAKGQMLKHTEWIKVVLFNQLAERAMEFLKTGSLVFVTGRMHTRKFQDKDHRTCSVTEILATDFITFAKGENKIKDISENEDPVITDLESLTSISEFNSEEIPF